MEQKKDQEKEKPSLEEVVRYAEQQLPIYLHKYAQNIPEEHQEEMRQEAFVRVVEAYQRLEADKGWKSFIQMHCRGAIFDFIRWGKGYEEKSETNRRSDEDDVPLRNPWRLCHRQTMTDRESGEDLDAEQIAGFAGIFESHGSESSEDGLKVNWQLLSRMASEDQDIHMVGKLLMGFTLTDIQQMFDVTRERLTQRLYEFAASLDDPMYMHSRWTKQVIYALGLCAHFGMPEHDQGLGWDYEPVDLSLPPSQCDPVNRQMDFLGALAAEPPEKN